MYPYYILIVFSIFLFLHGYFPITTPTKNINNEPPTHISNISLYSQVYTSNIEKTVLIVIDALRLDFVNNQYMPLTSHITKENGCFNTIITETPTVTLPRIKALTAGNVPQFIDLVLNLASTEIIQDSLIHSLIKKGKKIVFYGDDTWLKLFPNFFVRHEGTNSFFVRDFKEVDDNVTRNVNSELEKDDWDVMILHYLGLDHIGHVYGPFSSYIPEKLNEMDKIIYNIYSKILKKNKKLLLLVTGDHGMRDSGGHGGSSYFETHVPLLAIGHNCDNGSFFQIDIPINLAVLLGVNIPSTCIGQIRSNFLSIPLDKYLFALRYNSLLLLDKANLCEDEFLLATELHEMYIKSYDKNYAYKAIDLYRNCSDSISKYLIKSSVKQNLNSLIISVLIMLNTLLILIKHLVTKKIDKILFKTIECITYFVIILIQLVLLDHVFSAVFVIILAIFLIINLIKIININKSFRNSKEDILKFIIVVSIIHPLTFLSSSFVEEEHQFWYFFNNLLILYTVLSKIRNLKNFFIWLGLLSALRFLRTINSTGDKWASYPDLSDWLQKSNNIYYYQLLFIFGLGTTFFTCLLINRKTLKANMLNFFILFCIYLLRNVDYADVLLGKLIWFLILCHNIFFYNSPKIVSWILISSLLLKPYNVILVSYCILTSMSFSKIYHNTTVVTLCHVWLSNIIYFAQGHSNSIASVDVSVGYIGLSEYHPLLVILQVLCHTYAFPVLCHFLVLYHKRTDVREIWIVLFCIRLYTTISTCIITVIFRHHLFIWSVFAPKLFIESVHLVFLFMEFFIYFCFEKVKLFLKTLNKNNC